MTLETPGKARLAVRRTAKPLVVALALLVFSQPALAAPPTGDFTVSPAVPDPGELVTFTSTGVTDPDGGGPPWVQWDFGDGGGYGPTNDPATHVYTTPGTRTVRMLITDSGGETIEVRKSVRVNAPSLMSPFPVVRIVGRAGRGATRITRMSAQAPSGATVTATCVGKSCPKPRTARRTSRGRSIRFRRLERRLRKGTKIGIRVTFPGQIGKYTSFIIRRNKRPARRDLCLRPGVTRPVACPSE